MPAFILRENADGEDASVLRGGDALRGDLLSLRAITLRSRFALELALKGRSDFPEITLPGRAATTMVARGDTVGPKTRTIAGRFAPTITASGGGLPPIPLRGLADNTMTARGVIIEERKITLRGNADNTMTARGRADTEGSPARGRVHTILIKGRSV
jgi:hypothetical protein